MIVARLFSVLAVAVALLDLSSRTAEAVEASSYFEENCAACHSLGEAGGAGPGLAGLFKRRSREWVGRFILDPGAVVASGDRYAVKLVADFDGTVMPSIEGMTPDIAKSLAAFLESKTGKPGSPAVRGPARAAASPAEVSAGKEYFSGRKALNGGGGACHSCHDVR